MANKVKDRRDGTGSIFQEKDGHWRAQIRYFDHFKGKSVTVRRRAKNRDEARAKLKDLLTETQTARPVTTDTTVAAFLDTYATNTLPNRGVSAASVAIANTLIVNPLKPTLGEVTLRDFSPAVAEQWLARLHKAKRLPRNDDDVPAPLAGATLRKAFYVLKIALDVAVRDKHIPANPLIDLVPPRAGKTPVPSTSAADFDDVIVPAVAGTRIESLVIVVGLTGCRLGEALGLRWTDVDLTRATATFTRSSATTDRTKGGDPRTVPLVPEVVAALKLRRKAQRVDKIAMGSGWQDTQGLIFTTAEGNPIDDHNERKVFVRILANKGLNTARPFHSLRHGLATRLLQRDVPMHVVSAILGHSSINLTVDTYGHVEPVMHAAAMAKALGK